MGKRKSKKAIAAVKREMDGFRLKGGYKMTKRKRANPGHKKKYGKIGAPKSAKRRAWLAKIRKKR